MVEEGYFARLSGESRQRIEVTGLCCHDVVSATLDEDNPSEKQESGRGAIRDTNIDVVGQAEFWQESHQVGVQW